MRLRQRRRQSQPKHLRNFAGRLSAATPHSIFVVGQRFNLGCMWRLFLGTLACLIFVTYSDDFSESRIEQTIYADSEDVKAFFVLSDRLHGDQDTHGQSKLHIEAEVRFKRYVEAICSKCRKKQVECGCHLGNSNPAFKLLKKYANQYLKWREHALNFELNQFSYRWIVMDFEGGLGNQLLKFVNGLLIALISKRILVLNVPKIGDADYIYDDLEVFDSVIPWMTTEFLQKHDYNFFLEDAMSTFKLDLWTKPGVEFLMCGDFDTLENYETIHAMHGQDVHLLLANGHYRPMLEAFHGLNFFFLSHFLWTGRQESQGLVQISTLPKPMAWDGTRILSELIADLNVSGASKIVSLQIRTGSFLDYIDTYHYSPGWQHCCHTDPSHASPRCQERNAAMPLDFCFSSSLDSILTCLIDLIQDWKIKDVQPSTYATAESEQNVNVMQNVSVILLWATDDDVITAHLRDALATLPAVHIVRIRHELVNRHDRDFVGAMYDMLLLGMADEMIASAMSIFSYAVHARGLITPHYLSYRDPCSGLGAACGRAAGPEAGLLAYGRMHDSCVLEGNAHEQVHCERLRDGCVSPLLDPGWTGEGGQTIGCLQSAARCLDQDVTFALPYDANISHANQFQHIWAKRKRELRANYTHLPLPRCPDVLEQMERIRQSAIAPAPNPQQHVREIDLRFSPAASAAAKGRVSGPQSESHRLGSDSEHSSSQSESTDSEPGLSRYRRSGLARQQSADSSQLESWPPEVEQSESIRPSTEHFGSNELGPQQSEVGESNSLETNVLQKDSAWPATTVHCVDNYTRFPHVNRTCKYHSLYFFNGEFYALVSGPSQEHAFAPSRVETLRCSRSPERGHVGSRDWVFPSHFQENIFVPHVRVFPSAKALQAFLASTSSRRSVGIHVLTGDCHTAAPIHSNLGHGILDDLYPMWYGLLKFGLGDEPFTILMRDDRAGFSQTHEIFAQFAFRPLQGWATWPADTWVRLDTVVVGVGSTGLTSVSDGYQMSGLRWDALRAFRDRMYRASGLAAPPRRTVSNAGRFDGAPLHVTFVPNKRSYGDLEAHAAAVAAAAAAVAHGDPPGCPGPLAVRVLDFQESFLWEDQVIAAAGHLHLVYGTVTTRSGP